MNRTERILASSERALKTLKEYGFDPKGHFTKVGEDDYVGPSGKHFTYAQVKLYYSAGGWDNV